MTIAATVTILVVSALGGSFVLPVDAAGWGGLLGVVALQSGLAPVYFAGIARIGALKSGMLANIQPVTSIVAAFLLFGEWLTPVQLLGGAMVIAGILIMQRHDAACGACGGRRNDVNDDSMKSDNRRSVTMPEDRIVELERKIGELTARSSPRCARQARERRFRTTPFARSTVTRRCAICSGTATGCSPSTTWARAAATARCGPTASTACCRTWNRCWRWCWYRRTRRRSSASSRTRAAGGFASPPTAGGDYIREQNVVAGGDNYPGAVLYQCDGDTILRRNTCVFGPWRPVLRDVAVARAGGAGLGPTGRPSTATGERPAQLDDGGKDVLD